jgi:hypothetical protein
MSNAIGIPLPRLSRSRAGDRQTQKYAVNGKVPGFTADFIDNYYFGHTSLSSAITHAMTSNSVMTDGYGPELVTNGSYSDGTTGWNTSNTSIAVNNGVATVSVSANGTAHINQALSTEVGKTYIASIKFIEDSLTGNLFLYAGTSAGNGNVGGLNMGSTVGSYELVFVATTTTTYISVSSSGSAVANDYFRVDSVSVREMPVLKWAPHNLLTYSEDLTHASWSKTATTITANAATAPDGTNNAFEITHTASSASYANGASLTSGAAHTIRIFAKYVDNQWFRIYNGFSNGNAWYDLQNGVVGSKNSAVTSHSITDVGDGWYLLEHVSNATSASTTIQFLLPTADSNFTEATGTSAYIWAPHIYRSDLGGMVDNPDQPLSRASYVPTTSSAVYLPRIGHHVYSGSAWANEGLLAESEARTNLIEDSNELNGSTWSATGLASRTANEVGPDGVENSAYTLTASTSTGSHQNSNTTALTSGNTYTGSMYVKKGTQQYVRVTAGTVTVWEARAIFDLDAGIVDTANAGTTARIEDVGNGWYRCSVSGACLSSTSTGFLVQILDASKNISYTGAGTETVIVYGAQVEEGSTPSSLIPTSGSSVTRAAESFTIPSANLPWPEPVYIGSELVTNGTFDTDSDWTKGTGWSISGGVASSDGTQTANSNLFQIPPITIGKLYSATYTISNYSAGGLYVYVGSSSKGAFRSANGTYTDYILASGANAGVYIQANANFVGSIDNISVREINPLSVSIAMDGRMTYANTWTSGTKQEAKPWRWQEDSNNLLHITIDSTDAGDGRLTGTQIASGTVDYATFNDAVAPDILSSINFATRSGSTFFQVASSGVSGTANTTPTALPDLSATDLNLALDFQGTIGTFRVWDRDITDDGLVEATNPSLEPSLSLTFEGTGTNSFIVNDWSE